jgi:hypothetical protein
MEKCSKSIGLNIKEFSLHHQTSILAIGQNNTDGFIKHLDRYLILEDLSMAP